ncbi:Rib/alpha-like domain-containing protein, partial [Macrococcus capreoli]
EDGTYDLTDNIKVSSVPVGTTFKDITPSGVINVSKAGSYTGIVEVTYPDGTKTTVEVPVIVTDVPNNTEHMPKAITEIVVEDGTYDLTDNIDLMTVPSGTTFKNLTARGAINTSKAGSYTGIVEVTYPDGTKTTVEVPVIVTDVPDNTEHMPKAITEIVVEDGTYDLTDNIDLMTVPSETTFKDLTARGAINTSKAGSYTGIVEVTYPDGTKTTVEVPVIVTDVPDNTENTPVPTTETVTEDGKYDLPDNVDVSKLPEGTTVKDVTPEGAINTSKAGNYTGVVEVTYPDGTKATVEVPVIVIDVPDNTENTPKAITETVVEDGTYDLTDNIEVSSVPVGTTFKDITPLGVINVSKAGSYTGIVEVTYPDGTKTTVEVPVIVTDVPDNTENMPKAITEIVVEDGTYDLTDNIDLMTVPSGTTFKDLTARGAINTSKAGSYTGIVEVTYPDGTKETVEVPVIVTDVPDNTENTPTVPTTEIVTEDGKHDQTDNVDVSKLPEDTTVKTENEQPTAQSSNNINTPNVSSNEDDSTLSLPDTGEKYQNGVYVGTAFVVGGLLLFIARRKKRETEDE